jgi:SAM-dependent methyltransferase
VRELPADRRVLELGPGPGHVARLARRPDLGWTGLESCLGTVSELRRFVSAVAVVDLEDLRRLPRGYDVVLAGDTLEHLVRPEKMLAMIHECLAPGGLLFASVPNVANLHVRLSLLWGRFPYADRGILDRTHRVFFTVDSFRDAVEVAGFVVEDWTVSTVPLPLALPRLPRPLVRVAAGILGAATRVVPRLLGYQVLVRARRV